MNRYAAVREQLLTETRIAIARAVTDDDLIIQSVTAMEQLDAAFNRLVKKAREWHALCVPELDRSVKDHEVFLNLALDRPKASLLEEFAQETTMGAALQPADDEAIRSFLESLRHLGEERERLLAYLEIVMRRRCPNTAALAGATIGAKLLSHAGSLDRLAMVPSSTLQLFGAETALFRHLRDKRKHRSPKYGVLFNHPLVQHAKEKGKAARALADKLSMCAKLDLFKGEERATEYRRQLSSRFGEW